MLGRRTPAAIKEFWEHLQRFAREEVKDHPALDGCDVSKMIPRPSSGVGPGTDFVGMCPLTPSTAADRAATDVVRVYRKLCLALEADGLQVRSRLFSMSILAAGNWEHQSQGVSPGDAFQAAHLWARCHGQCGGCPGDETW
eukprot:s10052_g1.t1